MAGDSITFARDASNGFLAAYSRYVQPVPDTWAAMRRGGPRPGKVSLVIGGGSGHYPAFTGLIGSGLADAAVIGEVFTSPSAEQVYRTGRAVDGGAGIVLSYGNYAGDVLNFGTAQDRLRAAGIDCRTVLVTDDVASAPIARIEQRRGIAGDFAVFKLAGAAAERGLAIDEVERLAGKANARTVSFGAAFRGCTLPGADHPLFRVAPGTMELGLGIHGEPGVRTVERTDADGLAGHLVQALLAERPSDHTGRIAVVLNGLGATKYEELFGLFTRVESRLRAADLALVAPEVGELVTSLDMAGVSLTITWLDEELAELWTDPADTPAFRRNRVCIEEFDPDPRREPIATAPATPADDDRAPRAGRSRADGSGSISDVVGRALAAMLATVTEHQVWLGNLDAAAGDGDHGTAMVRGLTAACAAAGDVRSGARTVLTRAADAFADRGAGTSGLLWGVLLRAFGDTLGDDEPVDARRISEAINHATAELARVGGARPGDKTMLDALLPFADRLSASVGRGGSLVAAWLEASDVATEAAAGTAQLVARVGRARPLGERSLGTPDPGATSLALCLAAVGAILTIDGSGSEAT